MINRNHHGKLRCLISCGLQQHPPLNRQHRLFRVKRVRRYFQPGNLGSALAGISLLFVEEVISCSCEWSYRDNDWVERLGTPFFYVNSIGLSDVKRLHLLESFY